MKRFTDTEKWSDVWFRKLPPHIKLFWNYLCDKCSNAGVWKPDFELASFCIGSEIKEEEVLKHLKERVQVIQCGWYITKFIDFQYGILNPTCRPHAAILSNLHTLSIPYLKGINTHKKREGKGSVLQEEGSMGGEGDANLPTITEILKEGEIRGVPRDHCQSFFDHYEGKNLWLNQHGLMINWRHMLKGWSVRARTMGANGKTAPKIPEGPTPEQVAKWEQEEMEEVRRQREAQRLK